MKPLLIHALLFCAALPAAAIYLGPPTVHETPAARTANLNKSNQKLAELQQAAKDCADIRLALVHSSVAFLPKPIEIPLSELDKQQLRHLISRMRAVKSSSVAPTNPEYIARLYFMASDNRILAKLDIHEVTTDNLVNAQGYASGARLSLSAEAATLWHSCLKPEHVRSIARQPNPARTPSGRRRSRIVKRPEPEPATSTQFDFPQQEYHTNCKHKHGKHHKHKSKNHWCSHHH